MNFMPNQSTNNQIKLKFWVKLSMFIICVFTLSLFFEAVRKIQQDFNTLNMLGLVTVVILNGLVLFAQAFLIYYEEKMRGNLKKKVGVFDSLINFCTQRRLSLKEENNSRES